MDSFEYADLHLGMPDVARFRSAVEYVHSRMPERQAVEHGQSSAVLGVFLSARHWYPRQWRPSFGGR